jgi:hypothetical protein
VVKDTRLEFYSFFFSSFFLLTPHPQPQPHPDLLDIVVHEHGYIVINKQLRA